MIAFEIINIFLKPIFGITYDKLKFKYTMLIYNIITVILIINTYFALKNSIYFGILSGFNSLMMGVFVIILNSASIDIFGKHNFQIISISFVI